MKNKLLNISISNITKLPIFLLLLTSASLGQNAEPKNITAIELPTGAVPYEMRLGAVDLRCGIDFKYDDQFDQKATILDAVVEFSEPEVLGGVVSEKSRKFKVIRVTTGSKWIGVLNTEDGSVYFDSKKIVDTTDKAIKDKFGSITIIMAVDSVSAEYVRGTIHGTITSSRIVSGWLGKIAQCTGEATFLMLPK